MSIDINLLILITAMIFIIKACIYILTAVRLTSSQICCFMLTAAALALDYKCKRPHKPRRQRRVLGGALRCVWHLLQHDGGHRRRQPQRLPAVQVPPPLQSGPAAIRAALLELAATHQPTFLLPLRFCRRRFVALWPSHSHRQASSLGFSPPRPLLSTPLQRRHPARASPGRSAITFVYDEGRFPTTIASRIVGPITGLLEVRRARLPLPPPPSSFILSRTVHRRSSALPRSARMSASSAVGSCERRVPPARPGQRNYGRFNGCLKGQLGGAGRGSSAAAERARARSRAAVLLPELLRHLPPAARRGLPPPPTPAAFPVSLPPPCWRRGVWREDSCHQPPPN